MQESDELLYRRFLDKGDENDLRILLERHKERLMLFLYGYVHNMEDAEELMLDAYATVAAGAPFSRKSSFKTWLFAIGKKLALMRLRKKSHIVLRSIDDRMDRRDEAAEPPPEFEILRKERDRQLYQAIRKLKDDYRQILILVFFEEMSHEEAGRVMGKTRKQTYNLVERGKKALKAELERMGFDYAQF